ncbi:hypothetical protein QBC47DRAFT_378967 [Echria macrotheca]|uniref:Uncharacterized protein n=1 Tax=Echria macrotheca TaxID=438768 RepID=A0AAJ0FC44_9PEZI|nr:hypothetical protein QBC47DRAFT_378967 [Echria macrotheca]
MAFIAANIIGLVKISGVINQCTQLVTSWQRLVADGHDNPDLGVDEDLRDLQQSLQRLQGLLAKTQRQQPPALQDAISRCAVETGSVLDRLSSNTRGNAPCRRDIRTVIPPDPSNAEIRRQIQYCSSKCRELAEAVSLEMKDPSPMALKAEPRLSRTEKARNIPSMPSWLVCVVFVIAFAGAMAMSLWAMLQRRDEGDAQGDGLDALDPLLVELLASPATLVLGTTAVTFPLAAYHLFHTGNEYRDLALLCGIGTGVVGGIFAGLDWIAVILQVVPWCALVMLPLTTYYCA